MSLKLKVGCMEQVAWQEMAVPAEYGPDAERQEVKRDRRYRKIQDRGHGYPRA